MLIPLQDYCLSYPVLHEHVSYKNYEFEVLEIDTRRILKVKFTVKEPVAIEIKGDM